MKLIFTFISNYYYIFVVPLLSIAVFFVSQYLTRGINYFIGKNGIKWGFLGFMAALQFFVSIMITWSVLSAFSSDFLSKYETIKITAIIIIGGAPFNITILVWVALKLETYRLMKKRYGKEFKDDSFFEKIEAIERDENAIFKEANKAKEKSYRDVSPTLNETKGLDVSALPQHDKERQHDKEKVKHDKDNTQKDTNEKD